MKKLLMVVDMQNDFIDGSLGTPEAKAIVQGVTQKIMEYEDEGHEVLFTQDTHDEHYLNTLEGKNLPVEHCIKGTFGWQIEETIGGFQGKRLEKITFGSTECMDYVKTKTYESIELVGLCTDICVISNALLLKAALPETPILVDSKCCAGVTKESHENALEAMKMCQIEVI